MNCKNKNFCAIDLGSHKITAAIGFFSDNDIKILGISQIQSKGIKLGYIINFELAIETINAILNEVINIAGGLNIKKIILGISSPCIKGFNSYGLAAVENNEVSIEDLSSAIKTAKAIPMPGDTEILHILQRDYIVDGQPGVIEPIGMSAVRLESNIHIIVISSRLLENIKRCFLHCGYVISDIVAEQLASSNAIISDNEKDMGSCFVNIGSDLISFLVFTKGGVCYTSSIKAGGLIISLDISKIFKLPIEVAENLKLQYGYAESKCLKNSDEKVYIPNLLGDYKKTISLYDLSLVIEARVEEIFKLLYKELDRNVLLEKISSGIIFTGGGAKLKGIIKLAENIFKLPIRIGGPFEISGADEIVNNPSYSTVIGLLKYAADNNKIDFCNINGNKIKKDNNIPKSKNNIMSSIKYWFLNNFS